MRNKQSKIPDGWSYSPQVRGPVRKFGLDPSHGIKWIKILLKEDYIKTTNCWVIVMDVYHEYKNTPVAS